MPISDRARPDRGARHPAALRPAADLADADPLCRFQIGLDPIEVLVIPRLFALLLTLPMLTLYADFASLFGGWLMTWADLGITVPQFLRQLHSALSGWTFWIGVMKSPFFATIIALVGCYEGLRVGRSAESVGRQTTLSVVEAIFLVIVSDAAFSILFSILQI